MMVTIRTSRAGDGAHVVGIWQRAVDATHDFVASSDRAEIEAQVRTFLPAAPLWLAVDADDRPLGFMLLEDAHMAALFVDPAVHGQGIGAALVRHGLAMAGGMTTDVNEQNRGAIGFYARMGFVATGRSPCDGQGRPYPLIHLAHGGAGARDQVA